MTVIRREAGKRGASHVLVKELHPIKSVASKPLDEVLGDLACLHGAHTTRIARAPVPRPVLKPQLSVVRAANRLLALVFRQVLFSVVSRPEMVGNPSRPVAETADVPPALPRHPRKLRQRLVAPDRGKPIRINPGAGPLPGHHYGHHRRVNVPAD